MLLLVILLIVVVLVLLMLRDKSPETETESEPDPLLYQARVDLRNIRRRLDLAWFKHEVRRDATTAQRELHEELRRLDKDA
jgi:hypothetical protein